MSKEVKRYYMNVGVDHPDLTAMVTASDYDALLAERDALKALLISSREFVALYVNNSFFGPNARMQLDKVDAALQGEQP